VQHRIRSRDLSNVVKLGRSVQLVELLGIHAQLTADGDGQVRHLANVVTELRLTLLQCLHEHVSCLRRDGRPVEQPVGPVSEGVVVRLEAVEIEERPGRVGLACPAVHEGSHGASFGITAYRALATRQQLALGANNRSFAQPSTVPRRTMEFRILGLIDVRNEAGAVALGGKKPRAVLAVLLLHANEPVSAERLALALWGEDAPGGAVKTVQVHVSRLRRALGDPGIVATTAGGYRLRVRPDELDAERFERLVEEGRAALAGGQPEHASALLRGALSLWRGSPLADLADEPFAAAEIARLDEERLAALDARVEADLAAGCHDALVGELAQLVADNPTRERLAGQLMLTLYRCGRQAESLEAYAQARRVLVYRQTSLLRCETAGPARPHRIGAGRRHLPTPR